VSGVGTTRRNRAGAFAALDERDRQPLELVVRLPLAPPSVIACFTDGRRGSAYRQLRSLLERGLISALVSPWRTSGRPARLLYTTRLGLGMLARSRAMDPQDVVGQSGLEHVPPTRRRLAELAGRLVAYELLGLLAAAHPGNVRLVKWERPWRRVIGPTAGVARRTVSVVRLPAAATLAGTAPRRPLGRYWYTDEMFFFRGKDKWYLYRAMDEHGQVVDVLLRGCCQVDARNHNR
jgi:hypothetical protein